MKSANSLLLSLGLLTGFAVAQQPPPPPPPPPAPASQPSVQAAPAANPQAPDPSSQNPGQNQAPPTQVQQPSPEQNQVPQNQVQQNQTQQNQVPQNQVPQNQGQQNPAPQGQSQPTTQQNPTEPTVPAPQQQPANQVNTSIPEADRMEAERVATEREAEDLRIKTERLEAEQQVHDLRIKDASRLRESRAVLKELLGGKLKIPNSLLQQSKCVIVIPSVKKLASGFGVKYGRGVMTCRTGENFNGPWSAPSMYALEGGNFGFQIGLQATDLVLLVMNDRGVDSLLGSKIKLGGDLSVAAGPIGRSMEASTDLALRAKILAYSRARGIFAGVALDGSTLRPDNNANEALYGREISAREIIRRGTVMMPASAGPLIQLLTESTNAASDSGKVQGQQAQR